MSSSENHDPGKWGKCDFCGDQFTSETGEAWVELMAYNFCFGDSFKGVFFGATIAPEIEDATFPVKAGDLVKMPCVIALHWHCFPGYRAIAEMEAQQASKADGQDDC